MNPHFATDFPGGNGTLLGIVMTDGVPTVRFAAEPRNCPQALWFYFRLRSVGDMPIRLQLANAEQTLGGGDWSSNHIVYRWPGEGWRRANPPQAAESPGGNPEWIWTIPQDGPTVEVAFCYPYLPEDLAATLADCGEAFRTETIGLTAGGRPFRRILPSHDPQGKPVIYVVARQHAGETPGSWVLDGLLRHVAANPRWSEHCRFWAVPFANLDDVVTGSYGKDASPHDVNRSYGRPLRPEGCAIMSELRRLKHAGRLGMVLDLHAPAHRERRVYFPLRSWAGQTKVNPFAEPFALLFRENLPTDLQDGYEPVELPPVGPPSPGGGKSLGYWATEDLEMPAATLETSYQGVEGRDFTPDDYRRIGAALAETAYAHVRG